MPPKPKLRREAIIDLAFDHVRRQGWQGLTARHLAEQLNTSTKPIYFHFASMAELEAAVVKKALDRILDNIRGCYSGDPWIDQAVGVVLFAVEEKYLFRAIFDEKHVAVRRKYSTHVWQAGREQLKDYEPFKGLSDAQVEMIRRARWVCTHGLASLMNIANWPWPERGQDLLITMVQRLSHAVYNEFKNDTENFLSLSDISDPNGPYLR
ncbi:MAG: TetR/AcrR family transcriptional regulator [Desulfobacteraceae bacterium]|nr:TetR/AcrR family transcriptional regulator [Desulfobacteraceae bacterium]